MAPIVYATADSAQISLLSIYVVSLDEDNNTSASSFSDTDNSSEKHISDNSDNTDEGLSFHFCKGKSALKMKIKGKGCIISAPVTKKQTAAAAKLKLKIALKSKSKSKTKLVKQSLFLKKCEKCSQLSSVIMLLFSDSSSLLPSTSTLKTLKANLKTNSKCSLTILSPDKTLSSGSTSLFSEFSPLKILNKLLTKCKYRPTLLSHHKLKCVVKHFKHLNKVKACNSIKTHY